MNNKMTQREWDRVVGIGNPPHEYGACGHEYMEGDCPQCAEKDIEYFQTKLERGLKFTNHKSTSDRYPHDKDKS